MNNSTAPQHGVEYDVSRETHRETKGFMHKDHARPLPCPICGGSAQSVKETFYAWGVVPAGSYFYYECYKCHHRGQRFPVGRTDTQGYIKPNEAKAKALESWNREVTYSQKEDLLQG